MLVACKQAASNSGLYPGGHQQRQLVYANPTVTVLWYQRTVSSTGNICTPVKPRKPKRRQL